MDILYFKPKIDFYLYNFVLRPKISHRYNKRKFNYDQEFVMSQKKYAVQK